MTRCRSADDKNPAPGGVEMIAKNKTPFADGHEPFRHCQYGGLFMYDGF